MKKIQLEAAIHIASDCIESLLFGPPRSKDSYEFRTKKDAKKFLLGLHKRGIVILSKETLAKCDDDAS